MMESPSVNTNSLAFDRQITQFARDISKKLNKRIGEIEQSADNLESYCRQVCMQVNSVASQMTNIKNQKAVKQVVTHKNVLNDADFKTETKSIFENDEFLENYRKAIIDSQKSLPQLENYMILSSTYAEVGEAPKQNGRIQEQQEENGVTVPSLVNGKAPESPPPPPPPLPVLEVLTEDVKTIQNCEVLETEEEEITEKPSAPAVNSQADFLEQLRAAVASKQSPKKTVEKETEVQKPEVVPVVNRISFSTSTDNAPTIAPKLPVPKNSLFQDTDSDDDEELFTPKKLVPAVKTVVNEKPTPKEPEATKIKVEQTKTEIVPPQPQKPQSTVTTAPSTSKPAIKKSIFSSDSDSDDDFIRSLSKTNKTATKEVKKVVDPKPAVQTAAPRATVIPAIKSEKKPAVRKSLFDDSDSDSDLFSTAAKVKSTSLPKSEVMKKDIKIDSSKVQQNKLPSNIISKLENTLRFGPPPISSKPVVAKKEENQQEQDSNVATILKSRCRGPSNRRPPTRPHTSN